MQPYLSLIVLLAFAIQACTQPQISITGKWTGVCSRQCPPGSVQVPVPSEWKEIEFTSSGNGRGEYRDRSVGWHSSSGTYRLRSDSIYYDEGYGDRIVILSDSVLILERANLLEGECPFSLVLRKVQM